jgi:hypothetical protein
MAFLVSVEYWTFPSSPGKMLALGLVADPPGGPQNEEWAVKPAPAYTPQDQSSRVRARPLTRAQGASLPPTARAAAAPYIHLHDTCSDRCARANPPDDLVRLYAKYRGAMVRRADLPTAKLGTTQQEREDEARAYLQSFPCSNPRTCPKCQTELCLRNFYDLDDEECTLREIEGMATSQKGYSAPKASKDLCTQCREEEQRALDAEERRRRSAMYSLSMREPAVGESSEAGAVVPTPQPLAAAAAAAAPEPDD